MFDDFKEYKEKVNELSKANWYTDDLDTLDEIYQSLSELEYLTQTIMESVSMRMDIIQYDGE